MKKASKKEVMISWRPSNKATAYLRVLGVVDGRNGKRRSECAMNMNHFLNELFIKACESEMDPRHLSASPEELARGWVKQEIAMRNRLILDLQKEIVDIARSAPKTVGQLAEEVVSLYCPDN